MSTDRAYDMSSRAEAAQATRRRIIDAAGHHPELEQPEAFVDHVAAFLGA